ncbi:MAG: hypothetical protein KatS3mg052_1128 [Candidatus Roseilinea sp.]|nr:MAG: hypothetical protein KatS3mg052_1128 [Candidatus Roseilinea sp.]
MAHVPQVEPASPLPVANETSDEPLARAPEAEPAPRRDAAQAFASAHLSDAPDAVDADTASRVEFKTKPRAAAYRARPQPAPALKPAAPYRPKVTALGRPTPISGQRSRSPLGLVIILGTVLGVAALLAVAIAGSGARRESSARQIAPPIIATQPTTDASPAAAATEAAPTPTLLPSPTEMPALPTDTPLPLPTETPTPQPTDTPAAQNSAVTYTVKQGDSCWGIATRFNVSVDDLIRRNNLTADCLIRPGQELVITP